MHAQPVLRSLTTPSNKRVDWAPVSGEIPQRGRRPMTEKPATREHRGLEAAQLVRLLRDRVRTGIHAMQKAQREPPTDHPISNSRGEQLTTTHDSVLTPGELLDHQIRMW
jgi:hypothetical protein